MKSPSGYGRNDIRKKFENTVYRFMSQEFKHIFLNGRYKYNSIKLYLVTSAYRAAKKYGTFKEYSRIMDKIGKMDSLRNDLSLSMKPIRFRNRLLKIDVEIPPNPIITKVDVRE